MKSVKTKMFYKRQHLCPQILAAEISKSMEFSACHKIASNLILVDHGVYSEDDDVTGIIRLSLERQCCNEISKS